MRGAGRHLISLGALMLVCWVWAPEAESCSITVTQEDMEAWAAENDEMVELLPSLARRSEDGSHRKPIMEEALTILWSDTPRERLLIAREDWIFAPLEGEVETGRPGQEARLETVADSLGDYLAYREDQWILFNLIESLRFLDSELLMPHFRDALAHPSASIRELTATRFHYFRDREVAPLLEARWRWEEDAQVRLALVRALAEQGSRRYAEDFLRLARGEDERVAEIAAWALARLGDDRVRPVFERWARSDDPRKGMWALEVLLTWPKAPGLLELALRASRSDNDDVVYPAVLVLGALDAPEAESRLVDLAIWSGDVHVRVQAIAVVDWERHRDSLPALRSTIPRVEPESRDWLESTIQLAAGRSRAGEEAESGTEEEHVPPRPPYRPIPEVTALVAPPPGHETLPCLIEPGFPADSETPGSMKAGTEVTIDERFVGNGTEWSWVSTLEGDDCWVLREHLEVVTEPLSDQPEG